MTPSATSSSQIVSAAHVHTMSGARGNALLLRGGHVNAVGDLAELRRSRTYTQSPTSFPLAARFCDLSSLTLDDTQNPPPGAGTFYLVAGRPGPSSSELGVDSAGFTRPNPRPCP